MKDLCSLVDSLRRKIFFILNIKHTYFIFNAVTFLWESLLNRTFGEGGGIMSHTHLFYYLVADQM
jgi:hypothetical protein